MPEMSPVSRRAILGGVAAGGALTALGGVAQAQGATEPARERGQTTMIGTPFEPHRTVRVG